MKGCSCGDGLRLAGKQGRGSKLAGKGSKLAGGMMPNKWFMHLMMFRKSHPMMSLKDAMHEAKKSYKK